MARRDTELNEDANFRHQHRTARVSKRIHNRSDRLSTEAVTVSAYTVEFSPFLAEYFPWHAIYPMFSALGASLRRAPPFENPTEARPLGSACPETRSACLAPATPV
jgi:hypothetical protein